MIIKSFIVEEPKLIEVFYSDVSGKIWICEPDRTARENIVMLMKSKFNELTVKDVSPVCFDDEGQVMIWNVRLPFPH